MATGDYFPRWWSDAIPYGPAVTTYVYHYPSNWWLPQGWVCPKCGRPNNPALSTCPCFAPHFGVMPTPYIPLSDTKTLIAGTCPKCGNGYVDYGDGVRLGCTCPPEETKED